MKRARYRSFPWPVGNTIRTGKNVQLTREKMYLEPIRAYQEKMRILKVARILLEFQATGSQKVRTSSHSPGCSNWQSETKFVQSHLKSKKVSSKLRTFKAKKAEFRNNFSNLSLSLSKLKSLTHKSANSLPSSG